MMTDIPRLLPQYASFHWRWDQDYPEYDSARFVTFGGQRRLFIQDETWWHLAEGLPVPPGSYAYWIERW